MKKTLLATGAALALGLALSVGGAEADHHSERGGKHAMHDMHGDGGWHGQKGRRGAKMRRKMRLMQAIERFDANGDGAVSQEEVDRYRADRLAEFDADTDGALTLAEYEALWLDAMRKRMVRQFQRHDADGDGRITAEEFTERTRYMVMMRDRNEDGVLDLDDLGRGKGRHRGGRHGMKDRGMGSQTGDEAKSDEKSE